MINANTASPYQSPQGCNSSITRAATQRQIVLDYLQTHRSITTLTARNELYIMGIAARVFELKAQGHNIVTNMVPASYGSKRKIASYVLFSGCRNES